MGRNWLFMHGVFAIFALTANILYLFFPHFLATNMGVQMLAMTMMMLGLTTIFFWFTPWGEDWGIKWTTPYTQLWRGLGIFGLCLLVWTFVSPTTVQILGRENAQTLAFFMSWSLTGALGVVIVYVHFCMRFWHTRKGTQMQFTFQSR